MLNSFLLTLLVINSILFLSSIIIILFISKKLTIIIKILQKDLKNISVQQSKLGECIGSKYYSNNRDFPNNCIFVKKSW
jgi:hypothetical protein